jgi:dihydrofolate reductase
MIVAMTKDRIIGKGGKLPWRLPDDMKHFKTTTMGHAIIMGRKTWEETGRPLPGRRNLVVTSRAIEGVETFRTIEAAIEAARTTDAEPYVIGGGEIYKAALPFATKLVITWVKADAEGDTRFPEIDFSKWKEVERRPGEAFDIAFYSRVE